jgi:hypothetical protein
MRSYSAPAARQFRSGPTVRSFNGGSTVRNFNGGTVRQFNGSRTRLHSGGPSPQFYKNNGNKHVVVRHRRGHGGPVYIFGYGPGYALYANDQCYQYQQVPTPYGWRYAWVNICADYGYGYDYDYDY